MTKSDNLKTAMIQALTKSLGRVSDACRMVDISRQTHYRWMEEDAEYKEAVANVDEAAIDYVESKLFELIDGPTYEAMTEQGVVTLKDKPSAAAAIFYLKTKGKKRGYIERQELTGADDAPPLVIQINGNI